MRGDEQDEGAVTLAPGVELGRFALVRLLGRGGMGEVWAARDRTLDREVALKLIAEHRADSAASRERLRREALAMAKLRHHNVAVVYDAGEVEGRLFVAIEPVHGGTLRDWLATPRSRRAIAERFVAAARGLEAAHRAGVIHRDVKPENLLIDEHGVVKVIDFGIADVASPATGGDSSRTASELGGTPAYMAPEQLLGRPVDARGDQFALCVALWEALAGTPPFVIEANGVDPIALRVAAITDRRFARPARRLPPRLRAVLERGLAADPEARYPTMAALGDAVTAAVGRRRRMALAAGIAATVAVAAAIVWFGRGHATEPSSPASRLLVPAPWSAGQVAARLSRAGDRLAVVSAVTGGAQLLDAQGQLLFDQALPAGLVPHATAPGDDGSVLVAGVRGSTVEVWRLTGQGTTRLGTIRDATAGLDHYHPAEIVADGDGAVLLAGDVVAIARDGASHVLVRADDWSRRDLQASPSRARIAWIENLDASFQIRIVDRDGTDIARIGLPRACGFGGIVDALDWIDEHRLLVAGRLERNRAALCTIAIDEHGRLADAHPAGELAGGMLARLDVTRAGVAATMLTRDVHMSVAAFDGALRDLDPAGYETTGAIWLDARTLAVAARAAGRDSVLAIDADTGRARVLDAATGDPVLAIDGHLLTHGNEFTNCDFTIDDGGPKLTVTCDADAEIVCAGFAHPPCLLADDADGARRYRWIDPRTLAIGERAWIGPHLKEQSAEALSGDGRTLASISGDGVLKTTALATGETTAIGGDPSWMFVAWEPDGGHLVVTTLPTEHLPSRVLRVARDGTTTVLAESRDDVYGLPRVSPDGKRYLVKQLRLAYRYQLYAIEPR